MRNTKLYLFVIILSFIIINLITYLSQNPINVNDGKDWDGTVYYKMAENFSKGEPIIGAAPYIYRIGTPYLASLVDKDNLMKGFYIVNIFANFVSCILLYFFLRIYIKNFSVQIILILLFLTHWLCNVRLVYFFPTFTDYWGVVFFLSGLLLIEKFKYKTSPLLIILITLSSFLGVLFREYLIIIPLSFLFVNNPVNRKNFLFLDFKKISRQLVLAIIPVTASVLGIIITHYISHNTDDVYSFFGTGVWLFYGKSLVQFVYALFLSIGPVISLMIFFYRQIFKFLVERQYLFFVFISAIIISYAGGIHTERFILWFMPVILLLLGIVIENNLQVINKFFIISILTITQCLSNRVFFPTPDPYHVGGLKYPILTVIGNGNYHNLTSMLPNWNFQVILFTEYCITVGIILILLYYSASKQKKNPQMPDNINLANNALIPW